MSSTCLDLMCWTISENIPKYSVSLPWHMIQRVVNACGGDWQIHEGEQKAEMASRGLLLGTQQSTSSVSHFPYFMLSIFILLMVPNFKRGMNMRWEMSVCYEWSVISLLSKIDCSFDITLINSQNDHLLLLISLDQLLLLL